MNKNKKRTASGLILAGTSLASIAGQAATNVNAEGSIFGSIKNFFVGNSSSKAQKDKAVKLKDKARSGDLSLVDYIKMSGFVLSSLVVPMTFAGVVVSNPVILSGVFVTLVLFAHINKIGDKKIRSDASKAAENIIYKLKHEKGIKEDMLNKQYTLKEFEDIVKDDEECSEFIRQLLVLERNPDEIDDEGYKLLDNGGELEDAKEVLRKLFLEVDSVDKINELKKLPLQRKEKLLKVIKPLFEWVQGDMPSLFGEGNCFFVQNDSEFCSKVSLLRDALDDKYYIF